MAEQEFLASYGVDIDEAGVTRLQSILSSNKDLANDVAAGFKAATNAVKEYQSVAMFGNKNGGDSDGSSSETGRDSGGGGRDLTALKRKRSAEDPMAGIGTPEERFKNVAQMSLSGMLYDEDSIIPSGVKQWALSNLETRFLGMATQDSGRAASRMVSWEEAGLASDPSKIPGFSELQDAASQLLMAPVAEARKYMQQALDADAAGEDSTEYIEKMREILSEPFERVRQMFDEFDWGESGKSGSEGNRLVAELKGAREELAGFKKDALKPVKMSANASGIVSAAQSALNNVRDMFSSPINLNVKIGGGGNDIKKSAYGGRFSSPTISQIAEDGGTEYVIPVNKEERAVPLLKQLLGELSPSARSSLAGSLSSGPAAGNYAISQQNVSAPVNINVTASGASAEEIGQSVYDIAERYLLRSLREVFA